MSKLKSHSLLSHFLSLLSQSLSSYALPSDVEQLSWDPFQSFHLYCATESGELLCIDIRNIDSPLFVFPAHNTTLSSLSFSQFIPGSNVYLLNYKII